MDGLIETIWSDNVGNCFDNNDHLLGICLHVWKIFPLCWNEWAKRNGCIDQGLFWSIWPIGNFSEVLTYFFIKNLFKIPIAYLIHYGSYKGHSVDKSSWVYSCTCSISSQSHTGEVWTHFWRSLQYHNLLIIFINLQKWYYKLINW